MEKNKSIVMSNREDLNSYREKIFNNLNIGMDYLKELLDSNDAFEFFKCIKYDKTVIDPLTGEAENLIEVINQCQTYMVSIMAVEYLFSIHSKHSFKKNFGKIAGYDIESEDGSIIAECFASTSYRSNNKLVKDLHRLDSNKIAKYKYEFFYDLEFTENSKVYYQKKYPDIIIIKFNDIK